MNLDLAVVSADFCESPESSLQSAIETRWLTPADEPSLVHLLNAVYGNSYAYKELYKPGGFSKLLSQGKLASLGEFDEYGELLSHTGFLFKDANGDFIESGLSFKHPLRKGKSHLEQKKTWSALLQQFSEAYSFIHQNTTTFHALAQRYAQLIMQAQPSGIIFNYTQGERLRGILHNPGPMHALCMTTVLNTEESYSLKEVYLPDSPWNDFFSLLISGLGLNRQIVLVDQNYGPREMGLSFLDHEETVVVIDNSPSLNLLRRRIYKESYPSQFTRKAHTDLIHLPCSSPEWVSEAFLNLIDQGFYPVGFRPNSKRPDEFIFQFLEDRLEHLDSYISQMRFGNSSTRGLLDLWKQSLKQIL